MNWSFLYFLAQPWFVIPWYAIGVLGVLFLVHDLHRDNTPLKPAMKWAWPIIVFFFSAVGLLLYFATARAPRIGQIEGAEEKKNAHHEYESAMWRRVNGAVIHCVAGDGLGIMTAMVIARAASFSFWQEFWFEYVVGFAIGWFVFQRKSMTMMTDSIPRQLAMAFRGEFFSMLTVMGGMGAVMTYVTPMVATSQPKPLTYAFWGFGMLGLLIGFIFTWPMNYMLVKLGWKHGMGGMEAAERKQVKTARARAGLLGSMSALGVGALVLVAWLTAMRQAARLPQSELVTESASGANGPRPLAEGVRASARTAIAALDSGHWHTAAVAMDAAHRATEVANNAAPGAFHAVLAQVSAARLAYQQGREDQARRSMDRALQVLKPGEPREPPFLEPRDYAGATVIDETGAVIGEVQAAAADSYGIARGGWRDAWGFLDIGGAQTVTVPDSALAFGPHQKVGQTLVMLRSGTFATAAR